MKKVKKIDYPKGTLFKCKYDRLFYIVAGYVESEFNRNIYPVIISLTTKNGRFNYKKSSVVAFNKESIVKDIYIDSRDRDIVEEFISAIMSTEIEFKANQYSVKHMGEDYNIIQKPTTNSLDLSKFKQYLKNI